MRNLLSLFLLFSATCFAKPTVVISTDESTIPVLDMRDYATASKRPAFMAKLSKALQDVGFFAVVNTDLDNQLIQNAYRKSAAFFHLRPEIKESYHHPEIGRQRGYAPIGQEAAKGEAVSDIKEFYHVGPAFETERLARLKIFQNVWPKEVDLETSLTGTFRELSRQMIPIQEAIAQLIGEERQFFTSMTEEGSSLLRAIHYPATQSGPENGVWAAAHTDINLLTVLPKATANGLEVQMPDGTWTRVQVPDNCFIVNVGDSLENITNGYFRSARHRVVADPETPNEERYSIVLFIHPRSNDRMDPRPQCIAMTGGTRKYANLTRWELLIERLADINLASDEMLKEIAEKKVVEKLIEVNRASPHVMQRLKEVGLASPSVLQEIEART